MKFLQKVKYIKEHVEQKDIDIFETFLLSHDAISGEYAVNYFQQMMGISLVKLLSVQPLQGPVGQIFKLRFAALETETETDENIPRLELQAVAIQASSYKYDNFKQDMFNVIWSKITDKCGKYQCTRTTLVPAISEATNNIARHTRRGVGNILITNSCNIGELRPLANNNGLTIVIDDMMPENIILIGYKGEQAVDAGIYFCPYMLSPNNTLRCAFHSDDASKNYYSLIEITDA